MSIISRNTSKLHHRCPAIVLEHGCPCDGRWIEEDKGYRATCEAIEDARTGRVVTIEGGVEELLNDLKSENP